MTIEEVKTMLHPGVQFLIPGNRARSKVTGEVISVKRVNFTYRTFYMDEREMILMHRMDDCEGIRAACVYPKGSKL